AIHRGHVKELLTKKYGAGFAKDSVRLILATLSELLGDAVEDGLLHTNPVHGIRTRKLRRAARPARRQQRIRPMTYEQLDTFLKTAEAQCPPRDALYFLVMADTGLCPGEGVGLQWSDVDCANRELHVQRSITGDRKVKLTKTESPRTVDLSARLVTALQARQEELEKEALLAGEDPSPWLFPSRVDRPLSPNVMGRSFREVRQAARPPHFTLYHLRHTFSTHLLMESAGLLYLSHQLRHAKQTTTLLYYAHFMPRRDKKHLDRMMARRGSGFSPAFAPQRAKGAARA